MKKLLLTLLCVPLFFSCGEEDQRKSWLEQWGYKGNMKSSEYITYYASLNNEGSVIKMSIIDNPFEGIDEWIFPYAKRLFNIYGNPDGMKISDGDSIFDYEENYADQDSFLIRDFDGYIIEARYPTSNQIQKHKYDIQGNWIKSDIHDVKTKKIIRTAKISYERNKRKEALLYDSNGELFQKHKYGRYDKEKNFSEIIVFDSEDYPLYIIEFNREYY
jgi:hypothetical protein